MHVVPDRRVGAIGTDYNITLVDRVVRAVDSCAAGGSPHGEDAFVEGDAVFGDLTQEDVVEFWAGEN